MRYLSVCSGIEAATVAWHPLGWTPAAFSEIEAFPRAVLAHHYPSVPLHGDFTTIEGNDYGPIDLLVGGTPCQDFSVAGLRAGIAGDRGNLTLEFLRLAARKKPRWIVWENVPGVLSSDEGRALGAFLGGLAELGYGFAYRVLDAQYFNLAQRRARVFVVGYLGDWRRAAAVLFERESLLGHPAPRREEGKGVAPTIAARTQGGGGLGTDFDCDGGLIPSVSHSLNAGGMGRQDYETETLIAHALRGEGFDASEDWTGRGVPLVTAFEWQRGATQNLDMLEEQSPALIKSQTPAIAFSIMPMNSGKDYKARETDVAQPLMAGGPVGGNQGGDYIVEPVALAFDTTQITSPSNYSNPKPGDPCHPLAAGAHPPSIALGEFDDASAQEADAAETLRALRHEVGEEAFAEWRSRILDTLQSPEILRSAMHGAGIRRAAREAGRWLDDSALACPESLPAGSLRRLWEDGPDGRTPQGLRLAQQLAEQLGTALPRLPYPDSPRSIVRRLTPTEWERLMGFPDGYTQVPVGNKPTADGPRYKALGNSMAVPVMAWIGQRIAMVERLAAEDAA